MERPRASFIRPPAEAPEDFTGGSLTTRELRTTTNNAALVRPFEVALTASRGGGASERRSGNDRERPRATLRLSPGITAHGMDLATAERRLPLQHARSPLVDRSGRQRQAQRIGRGRPRRLHGKDRFGQPAPPCTKSSLTTFEQPSSSVHVLGMRGDEQDGQDVRLLPGQHGRSDHR